jgi:hypothetical protein
MNKQLLDKFKRYHPVKVEQEEQAQKMFDSLEPETQHIIEMSYLNPFNSFEDLMNYWVSVNQTIKNIQFSKKVEDIVND